MRKGFTRKPQADAPVSPVKNYITPGGLQRLREECRYLLTPALGQKRLRGRAEIDQALETLERTKRALRRQKWLQFFALLLTLAHFMSYGTGGQLNFMMLRDSPLSLIPLWEGPPYFGSSS